MSTNHPIARLRRVAVRLPELGDDGAWLAERIDSYLAGAPLGITLEEALDLAAAPGRPAWWTVEAKGCRNTLIQRGAAEFMAGLTPNKQAAVLSRAIRRYSAGAWKRDQASPVMPVEYEGQMLGVLFLLMTEYGGVPQQRQLRRILSDGKGLSWPSATPYEWPIGAVNSEPRNAKEFS